MVAERGVGGDEHARHATAAQLVPEYAGGTHGGLRAVAELVGHGILAGGDEPAISGGA